LEEDEMKRSVRRVRLGLATFAALGALTVSAQAACKGGFCVSGSDRGRTHIVDFTTTLSGYTHFNVATPLDGQHEIGRNQSRFTFRTRGSGSKGSYGMQACNRGGVFSKSNCSRWVHFNYTVK
jgi:hypothetical protein